MAGRQWGDIRSLLPWKVPVVRALRVLCWLMFVGGAAGTVWLVSGGPEARGWDAHWTLPCLLSAAIAGFVGALLVHLVPDAQTAYRLGRHDERREQTELARLASRDDVAWTHPTGARLTAVR